MNSSCGSGVGPLRAVAFSRASHECRAASVTENSCDGRTFTGGTGERSARIAVPCKGNRCHRELGALSHRISVIAERQGIGEHIRLRRRSPKWRLIGPHLNPTYLVNAFTSSGFVKGSTPENQPEVSELTALSPRRRHAERVPRHRRNPYRGSSWRPPPHSPEQKAPGSVTASRTGLTHWYSTLACLPRSEAHQGLTALWLASFAKTKVPTECPVYTHRKYDIRL